MPSCQFVRLGGKISHRCASARIAVASRFRAQDSIQWWIFFMSIVLSLFFISLVIRIELRGRARGFGTFRCFDDEDFDDRRRIRQSVGMVVGRMEKRRNKEPCGENGGFF